MNCRRAGFEIVAGLSMVIGLVLATQVAVVSPAGADVFCAKSGKAVKYLPSCNTRKGWNPVAPGEPGPQGPQGPQGPSGVIAAVNASGPGPNPTAQRQFLVPPAQVSVVSGEVVLVMSHRVFGTTFSSGALSLDLGICYRRVGDQGVTLVGPEMENQRTEDKLRLVINLNQLMTGLSTDEYEVGLCGDDDGNGFWNDSSDGNTTALVFRMP